MDIYSKTKLNNNLKTISYEVFLEKMGHLVSETYSRNSNNEQSFGSKGSYIYKDRKKDNIGYKIYRGFTERNFKEFNDKILVSELIKRQPYITKTKFPIGLISFNSKIIGQQIPYFDNYKQLNKLETIKNISIYEKILESIKEMYENGVMYLDIHDKNFIINKKNNVQTIDFEDKYIMFDDYSDETKMAILKKIIKLINATNEKHQIPFILKQEDINGFNDIHLLLKENSKKLKR